MPTSLHPGSRLRAEVVALRDQLVEARAAVREQHLRGLDAVQVCGRLTSIIDDALRRLAEDAIESTAGALGASLRERLVLVAHGGYGRRQLAPYSDIDLMVLYAGRLDPPVEAFARRLTQDVFDVGLELGQSLRSAEEAVRLAKADTVVCTSLIESRPLCGPQDAFDSFAASFERMVRRRPKAFSAAFVASRRAEREKYGETVFLLEPNIKRSRGALRDMHLLRWLWFVQSGESDIERMRMQGVLSKFDHHRLISARDFLLRVRNDLHFHSASAADQLTRAEQLTLAERLGYRGRPGLLPVEQFMRDYFRSASHVAFVASRMSELAAPRQGVGRVVDVVMGRTIEQDYRVSARDIAATQSGRAKLARRLGEAIRLLDLARLTGRRIAQDTWYHVYRSAPGYAPAASPGAAERFLETLDNPLELGPLLRRMHDLGVLEKLIPEYAHARCLLQFNQLHKYTVDEHCIRAVEEATRLADRQDPLAEAYAGLENKRMLHLALLIHDLGKGRDRDHSEVGAEIAVDVARLLGLSEGDARDLRFLVARHLAMTQLAFFRDTSDAELIDRFAAEVETPERLTMLYLLSAADVAAVGPGVFNAWKAEVLTQLHQQVMDALRPDRTDSIANRRAEVRNAAWRVLRPSGAEASWFEDQFAALPEAFVAGRSPEGIAQLLRRLRGLAPGQGDAWGAYTPTIDAIELLAGVSQGSGRGVFSAMAGAISAAGLEIFTAETAVLRDGLLVLRYVAQDQGRPGAVDPARVADVAGRMVAAIDSEAPPRFTRMWGADAAQRDASLTNLPQEVRLNEALSDRWLIVEVYAVDRRGLLYELARALHDLGLIIGFAKIGTYLDQVVDVFYVSERDGRKPTGAPRLDEVRDRLTAVATGAGLA